MAEVFPPPPNTSYHLPRAQPRNYSYVRNGVAAGHGSYSYVETKLFGQRGFPVALEHADSTLILPGAGGGARPTAGDKVGSYASGYSPNGLVLIRVLRIN